MPNVVSKLSSVFQSTLPMKGVTLDEKEVIDDTGEFQSTLPMKGVTTKIKATTRWRGVSIHTPNEGSDAW